MQVIPICLVTGFLGSGKTRLLRHFAERFRSRRIVYLVNEFSKADVDSQLLPADVGPVVSLPGGSIFCRCLVTEFIAQLRSLPERFHRSDAPLEGVIIEASGMANPRVITQMLAETRLDAVYRLASVIAVADPGSFLKLIHTLPNIVAQIQAADVVMLNKTDLFAEDQIRATETELRRIKPSASIVRTTFSRADLEPFPPVISRPRLSGEYAPCRDPRYESTTIAFPHDVDLERLRQDLLALGDELYRVKGFVPAGGECHYLDYSQTGLTVTPIARPERVAGLALVLKSPVSTTMTDFLKRMKGESGV